MKSLELAITVGKKELTQATVRLERQRRHLLIGFAVLAAVVIDAGILAFFAKRGLDTRFNEAAARVTAAQRQAEAASQLANQQIASTREAAERQVAEAQQTARRAQIVSDVLAAPDLLRFTLTGAARAPQSSAQLLWSRSRGLVFSGSRVPAAPGGKRESALVVDEWPAGERRPFRGG